MDIWGKTNGTRYVYRIAARNDAGIVSKFKSFVIYRVARPAITSLSGNTAGRFTVRWGKNTRANGYKVQYSLRSDFKGTKTITLSKNSIVSKTIGGLIEGKTYYVRVRAYKKAGNTYYYSAWSPVKKVKISR